MPFDHVTVDVVTSVLLPVVGFFLLRVIRTQDSHEHRLNNHSQRLSRLDQETEDA